MIKLKVRPDAVRGIMDAHGVKTQRELASRLGISAPLLTQMLNGYKHVGAGFIAGMYQEFGVQFDLAEDGLYEVAA